MVTQETALNPHDSRYRISAFCLLVVMASSRFWKLSNSYKLRVHNLALGLKYLAQRFRLWNGHKTGPTFSCDTQTGYSLPMADTGPSW